MALLVVAAVTAAGGALAWRGSRALAVELATPRDLHGTAHVGANACRRCHPSHWESWHRTFHRTMTAEATAEHVLGDFGGRELDYLGVTARMERGATGEYRITFARPATPERTVEVVRVVGSHRYQQYLSRRGDEYLRLPIAWHVGEARWFHMNGAFLTPDPAAADGTDIVRPSDYDRHVVRWNDNCVFCHNVAPNPGLGPDGRFRTEVAELGVACEACHGPGEEHARVNSNPLRRYTLHAGDAPDPTIINPARLSPARSADVCGRCHGQRKAAHIAPFLSRGDPFVPGDDLALYSEPLWRDSTLDGREAFRERFWPDGTPRLTAYEYQGLLQSPCAQRGELTCTTCHGMHEGDPRGQVRPRARGDGACAPCHTDLPEDHSRHSLASSGARCVACHMPRIVYGLVDTHRSHRIEVPDPARDARHGRPDACTSCHVDRDRRWATDQVLRMWDRKDPPSPRATPSAPARASAPALPEVQRALFGGDPIERALAADALGRRGAPRPAVVRAMELGALFDVMRDDPYPAVRRLAWRAARRRVERERHDVDLDWHAYRPTSRRHTRAQSVATLVRALPPEDVRAPDSDVVGPLRREAEQSAIHIGE